MQKGFFKKYSVLVALGLVLALSGKHIGGGMTGTLVTLQTQRPLVLIDQSHDFLFIVLHLGTFLKTHGFLGTLSSATLEPRIYRNCDVIITHQSWSDVPYTRKQVNDLRRFVSKGGGLLLIGYGPGYVDYAKSKNLSFDSWPINILARAFGFRFEPEAGKIPFVVQPHSLTTGVGELTFQDETLRLGIAKVPNDAVVLLGDSAGNPVLAAREFRKGRVAVLTEYRFIKTIDESTNEKLFVNLFSWLGANSPNKAKFTHQRPQEIFPGIELHKGYDYELADKPEPPNWNGGPDFIWPEIQIKRGGITLQYSASMRERADYIIQQYPVVYKTIFELFKVEPAQEMILEALPSPGSGYHWTKQKLVAIGALADDKAVLNIMSHEMVHAWGLPTPRNFSHGWTCFTDDYVSERLQLRTREQIAEGWNRRLSRVKEIDPNLNSLDIAQMTTDPSFQQILDTKVGWVLKELGRTYGLDFFPRLVRLYREHTKVPCDTDPCRALPLDDFIFYASLAAGEDLFPWFSSVGTTVRPRPINP